MSRKLEAMQNMQDYKLAVKELHKQYGNHKVIKGVSLRARAGVITSAITMPP